MALIGIDIGGTKILVCVGDHTGKILASERIPTRPLGGSRNGLPAIGELIRKLLKKVKLDESKIDAIGNQRLVQFL